jgi:hypothetical protein
MNWHSSIELKGGKSNENQIKQGIMENLIHAAWYHDSNKAVAGAIT